jgi:hypothetical protein
MSVTLLSLVIIYLGQAWNRFDTMFPEMPCFPDQKDLYV